MLLSDVLECLRGLKWQVVERQPELLRLPDTVVARHPRIPTLVTEFLGSFVTCEKADQTEWFLSGADFAGATSSAFRWDAWEQLSLEAAGDDDDMIRDIYAFWDAHIPILLSVRDGYAYHAVKTAADGFGRVVAGREPEFEEADVLADSFEEYLRQIMLNGGPCPPYNT